MDFGLFNQLMADATRHLYEVKGLQPRTVDQTIRKWRHLRQYMEAHNISSFNRDIGQEYLIDVYSGKSKSQLTASQKCLYNSVEDLWEFQETGCMKRPNNYKRKIYDFNGEIGTHMCAYFDKMRDDKLADNTVDIAQRALYRLLQYLNKTIGVEKIEDIYPHTLLNYIQTFTAQHQYKNSRSLSTMKRFFKFLYDNER